MPLRLPSEVLSRGRSVLHLRRTRIELAGSRYCELITNKRRRIILGEGDILRAFNLFYTNDGSVFSLKILTSRAYALLLTLGMGFILLSGLLIWGQYRRPGVLCLAVGFAVLWVFSTRGMADYLCASLERAYLPAPIEAIPQADAIIVLGGVIGPALPPRRYADLNQASDRLFHATRLYKAGRAPIVIASGGGDPPEAQDMFAFLTEWGVPRDAVLQETRSRNTYENAVFSKRIMKAHDIEKVLLVTSAMHMPRALAAFRSAQIDARPAPTDYRVVDGATDGVVRWLPDPAAMDAGHRAVREYLGIWAYRWRGWID